MRNSEYWQERFKLLEEVRHKAGAKVYKEIERQYKRAQKEIEAAIDEWYRRFAENNNVSMAEARKLLKADELKEFKWSVEEYIRRGEENAISGEWTKELENASAKFHVSRLDALKINIRQSIEALYGQQQSLVSEFLGETYKSDYYHTAFELMKGFEIGFDIGTVNEDYLQKVLFKPWAPDGRNFSDRIWENKEKLVNTLHKELTQSIMTGADPQKAIDAIAHDMNVSKANAGRLVMTESAYFGSLAQQDCFKELGVEEYEIVATLDDRTSEICQAMDGQHFPMKDFEAGVTAPPFHVNCRSCTCPYFDDEFSLGGERAARDANGEFYYVPADTTYPEWKEAFVDGEHEESDFKALPKNIVNAVTGGPQKVVDEFKEGLESLDNEELKTLFQVNIENTKVSASFIENSTHTKGVIRLSSDATPSTLAHEVFHKIDADNGITMSHYFNESIKEDYNRLLEAAKLNGKSVEDLLYSKYETAFIISVKGKRRLTEDYRGVSDIINGMSGGEIKLGYGHAKEYWEEPLHLEQETWAQFGRTLYVNNPEAISMLRYVCPTTYRRAMRKVKELSGSVLR